MRIMVYGDSNSWGFPPDGSGLRMAAGARWPGVMAAALSADLVEEALPGRTTAHDDPNLLGPAMNGLRHLPVALKSHAPLDWVVIMLGTNDFKARFEPDAEKIASNIARLVACLRDTGGGRGPWDSAPPPPVGVIVPPPLPAAVDDPAWERCAEWRGGREASQALAPLVARLGETMDFPVLDAGAVVAASPRDPIHLEPRDHKALGHAAARWLAPRLSA